MSRSDEQGLHAEDIAVVRAIGGKVSGLDLLRAHVTETGGEHRPQQEEMTEAVADALRRHQHLLVQAGTGTGKSLAYLFPLAAAGNRAVIATATNQLSEQLLRHDLPQVQETLAAAGQEMTFSLLKGRANYACQARLAEIADLDSRAPGNRSEEDEEDRLFDLEQVDTEAGARRRQAKTDASSLATIMDWSRRTGTGDRSEAPPVLDRVWAQVSTTSADCPGASTCPFGDSCFTERARAKARQSHIVVTNHALLAQDMRAGLAAGAEGNVAPTVFGQHQAVVIDEAHDFPGALTSALSSEVDARSISKFLSKAAKHVDEKVDDKGEPATIKSARADLDALVDALDALPTGPLETLDAQTMDLLAALTTRLMLIDSLLADAAKAAAGDKPKRAAAISALVDQAKDLAASVGRARSLTEGNVRWVDRDRRDNAPVLRTAPIEVGEALEATLEGRTLIATSATLTLGGDFTPMLRTLGFDARACGTLDVGSPFDYPNQGMLYVPGSPFPEPVGRDRTEHTRAVLEDLTELVRAAGGRTLALFTTTAGAQNAAAHLRTQFPGLTVHAHGDAPADVLVRQFAEEETSVLCATMGLWQGVSIEGASCSLVVIDKVAFAPVDDVLSAARRQRADAQDRDGFTEVVVAAAATSLAQGAGRLIRTRSDRGVVAILDPRLRSKGYGRLLLRSLPDFRVFADRAVVTDALTRLTGGLPDTALHAPTGKRARPSGGTTGGTSRRAPRRAAQTRAIGKGSPRSPKGGTGSS